MKLSSLLAILFLLLTFQNAFAFGPFGADESVVNSRHNLTYINTLSGSGSHGGASYNDYGEVCVYCHTPHNASSNTELPLWNRPPLTSGSFEIYSSASMDAARSQPQGVSLACLSCHDGSIAVDSTINKGSSWDGIAAPNHRALSEPTAANDKCGFCHNNTIASDHGSRLIGRNTPQLSDDHPISMVYNEAWAAIPGQFNDAANIAPLKLFNGRVECPTCHDVHRPFQPFDYDNGFNTVRRSYHLRVTNHSSNICQTCHIK